MNLKLLIPFPLSVVIWSGYVMFDIYNYYSNLNSDNHFLDVFFSFTPIMAIPIYAVVSYILWHEYILEVD